MSAADSGTESSPGTKSAAQLRAEKRQARIREQGSKRIASITTSARGEEGKAYLDQPSPFSREKSTQAASSLNEDPADVDISSIAPLQPRADPFADPVSGMSELRGNDSTGLGGQPDLMSQLFAGLTGNDSAQMPPEFANNPLFASMMNAAQNAQGQPGQQQEAGPPRQKTMLERLLPLLHLLSMIGLIAWAIWTSEDWTRTPIRWKSLTHQQQTTQEWVQDVTGLARPVPLFYAFVTIQLVLQSLQIFLSKNQPPPPGMLNSILPMLPHPFGLYVSTAIKYYALFGSILDDLSVLIVGIGLRILYSHYMNA